MRSIKLEITKAIDDAIYRRKVDDVIRTALSGEVHGRAEQAGWSLWGEVNRAAPFLLVDIRDDIKARME